MSSSISCKNVVKVKFDGPLKQPTKDLDPGNLPPLKDKNLINSNISHEENGTASPASDVMEQVERKSSISKPPPPKQLQNVILLLDQHNQNCGVDDCATLFLISSEWMQNWHRYVTSEDLTYYPGEIDNWDLIATADNSKCDVLDPVTVEVLRNRANQSRGLSFDGEELDFANEIEEYKAELRKNLVQDIHSSTAHKEYDYETCRFSLRLNLREDIDFYLLPIEVWQALYGWYGGGPPLPRYLFNTLRYRTNVPCNILNLLLSNDECKRRLDEMVSILSEDDLYTAVDDQIPTVQEALVLQERLQAAQLRCSVSTTSLGHSISTATSFQSMADLTNSSTSIVYPLSTVATGRTTTTVPPLPNTDNSSSNTEITATTKHYQPSTKCHVCHRISTQRCAKCNTIYYCSRDCQLLHWKYHKSLCIRETKKRLLELKQQTETAISIEKKPSNTQVLVVHDRAGKVGLANLGNSCYMNSSLQCLSHIKPLTLGFLSQRVMKDLNIESRDGSGGRLAEQYGKLLQELWFESAKPSVSPHLLKATLGRMNSEYAGLAQQDAHELIEYLLDKLHEDLNRVKKKPYTERVEGDGNSDEHKVAEEAWATHGRREDSVVRDVMGSLMRYQLVCPDCNKLSLSYEFHTTLQVAIPRQNSVTRRVVFIPQALHLPEVPAEQTNSNPNAVLDALLAATAFEAYDITIDRLSAVRGLREGVKRRISAPHLLSSDGDVLLVESAASPNCSSVARILKDSLAVATLSPDTVIYAYCAPIARPNHVFVFPRICDPVVTDTTTNNTVNGQSINDWSDLIDCSLVGVPILVSYEKHWACSRLRYQVLLNSLRFFRCDSEFYKKAAIALSASIPVQFQLSNDLDLRLADLHGGSMQSRIVLTTTSSNSSSSTGSSTENDTSIKLFEEYIHSIWESSSLAASGLSALGESKRQWLQHCNVLLEQNLTTDTVNADTLLTRCFGSALPSDKNILIGDFGNVSNPRAGESNGTMFLNLNFIHNRTDRRILDRKKIQQLLPQPTSTNTKNSNTNSTGITLYQCLQEHTKEEVLDAGNEVYCAKCKEHKAARKMVRFCREHLPPVLVLSLKRFEFRDVSGVTGLRGAAHREKIDSFVDFPIDGLDLAPFCQDSTTDNNSDGSGNSSSNSNSSTIYDLFAVCNHYGRMGFGHYTAAARDWEGSGLSTQWFSYDDNDVSGPLTPSEVEAEVHSRNAYILFYRQRSCPSTLD